MATPGESAQRFLEELQAKTERRVRAGESRSCGVAVRRPAPSCSHGTSPIRPRSSARRCTTSTKRSCGPTSRWSEWSTGMFDIFERVLGIRVRGETGRAGVGPGR